jgi:uncharacterized membrane protein
MTATTPLQQPVTAQRPQLNGWELWAVIGIIGAAAIIRMWALSDDFWFDEIWSWKIATQAPSVGQIFTAHDAQIDNNHPLNTLFMFMLGDQKTWQVYRILSFLTGTAVVVLAVRILTRFGKMSAVFGAALIGFSYPLIVYSSEARGYAPMICFALLTFEALYSYVDRRTTTWLLIYALAAILGMLSHLTFLQFYVAVVAWSAFALYRERETPKTIILDLLKLNVAPILFLLIYYIVFIRNLNIGGSHEVPLAQTIVSTLSLMLGGPESGRLAMYLSIAAGLAILACLDWLTQRRPDLLLFFIIAVVAAPAIFVLVDLVVLKRSETLFPRYFLGAFTFALLLFSIRLNGLYRRGQQYRNIAIAILCVILAGNLLQTFQFITIGRGHYYDAVTYMANQTTGPVITVTSDPNSTERTKMLLGFYQRYLPPGKRFGFEEQLVPNLNAPPEWLLISTIPGSPVFPNELPVVPGFKYVFDHDFLFYGLSGWNWKLYRLQRSSV